MAQNRKDAAVPEEPLVNEAQLQAFEELANREIERRRWWDDARTVIRQLRLAKREQRKAEEFRDAALADANRAADAIAAEQMRAAKEAQTARDEHAAMLRRDEENSKARVAALEAQVAKLTAATQRAQTSLTAAEEQRDRFIANATAERDRLTAELEGLRAEERAFKERFAALAK